MNAALQNAAPLKDQISSKDLFSLIRKRKVFFTIFCLVGFLVSYSKVGEVQKYHLQHILLIKNEVAPLDYNHLLHLRFRLMNDPQLLNELIKRLGRNISISDMRYVITVKLLSHGGYISGDNNLSDRYQLGLYVKADSEEEGRKILALWSELALAEIERMRTDFSAHLETLQRKLKEKNQTLQQFGHDYYPQLESPESKKMGALNLLNASSGLKMKIQELNQQIFTQEPLDTKRVAYLRGQLDANVEFLNDLSLLNRFDGLIAEIKQLELDIQDIRKKIFSAQSTNTVQVILSPRDGLRQIAVVSSGLAVVFGLLGVSFVEILHRSAVRN